MNFVALLKAIDAIRENWVQSIDEGNSEGDCTSKKAPDFAPPGTKSLDGHRVSDLGRVEPWTAHYDEYGPQIGRTDYNAGNKKQGIPDTHHHTKEWDRQYPDGHSTGDHLPGEFVPK